MKTLVLSLFIALIFIGLMILLLIGTHVKEYKKHKKVNYLYALITAICFFIVGLTGFFGLVKVPFYYFIVLQVLALVMGLIHGYFMYKLLPWAKKDTLFGELLFTIAILFIGGALLLIAFTLVKLKAHQIVMLSSLVWFVLPFLFLNAFYRLHVIPPKIFKNWYYPSDKTIGDPSDSELASPVVISFEFQKKEGDQENTVFRAKAPKVMQFGKLFYYFINDYNDSHPEEVIEVANQENKPFAWIFYHKPNWLGIHKYIDPDEPVQVNRIKENSVIVCKRVEEI